MKRGITMFPFLLIFVMIAGAIILMFFFQFGTDLLSTSEKINKLTVLKNIDQQLAFLFQNNALSNIELGMKSKITVDCSIVNGKPQTNLSFDERSLKSQKIIVAPITLEGKTIRAWTRSWNYPFKIENIYYLLPGLGELKNIKIYLQQLPPDKIASNKELKEFIQGLNEIPLLPMTTFAQITAPQTDKKLVILLDKTIPFPATIESNTRIIRIDFSQPLESRQVERREQGNTFITPYLGEELALALLFSRSTQTYECIEQQARTRLFDIITLYEKKQELLRCDQQDYTGIQDLLGELKKIANNPRDSTNNLEAFKTLEEINKEFRKINCPELYLS